MSGRSYNANVQVLQTPDSVVLVNEMIHSARIIPLDGSPHAPSAIRQWLGDSRGRWEDDTLVVETTNFETMVSDFANDRPAGQDMRLIAQRSPHFPHRHSWAAVAFKPADPHPRGRLSPRRALVS